MHRTTQARRAGGARARATIGAVRRREVPGGAALLNLYNTLGRHVEPFEARDDRLATMYVCGITPYDAGHLGHALVYVVFDTLRRYLEFQSYEVRHIQNITDVDDDMVRVSRESGLSIAELTDSTHRVFVEEMDALAVQRPLAYPRVSETIPEIIALIEELIARGHAYAVGGHVFFAAASAPSFGELSGQTLEELRNAPRTDTMPDEPDELKRDPLDFLLWMPSDYPGASFPSPWGPGRPGWHVECSAMARASLGDRIDIHGGGRDLVYPHHESEIAQSECATGLQPFVRFWMHVGTVTLDGVKMSKSLGNLVKVRDLLEDGHTPDGIRLYLLATHYRDEHPYREVDLDRWEGVAADLARAVGATGGPPDRLRVQPLRNAFMDAMDDDLDTPRAIEVLRTIAADLERGALDAGTAAPTLIELGGVLGLRFGRAD